MRLDDLKRTLEEARDSQQIGEAVSLRVHLQLSAADANVAESCAAILDLASTCFDAEGLNTTIQESNDGRQISLLGQTSNGRSVFVTVGAGAAKSAYISLLLVGNHGTVELNGGHRFDERQWDASLPQDAAHG
ncbi:MAG: hypothetical protein CMJ78_18625 [Planctomycetaceae bacterium]|nr:hypothetical protein [Planctomycetaceae bacterium]